MQVKQAGLLVLGAALLLVVNGSYFTVSEGTQALITQFGEIKGQPIDKAGIHWKTPFIQDVRYFDKRILSWDGDQEQIPTKDKKYIWVDTTARWRITDLRRFAESVQDESGARNRLDGILDGVTRDTISSHALVEAVRNTNAILDGIAARKAQANPAVAPEAGSAAAAEAEAAAAAAEDEITGEIEKVTFGREQLSKLIVERARKELAELGIELIDVQLRRIAYEKSVEDKVYDRMISERNRIAEKIRSVGKGEEAKIRGKLNKDLKEIESEAYRKSQEVRGIAEAKAIQIYGTATQGDADFYEFTRTLAAYQRSLAGKGRLILSTSGDFTRYLEKRP
jgi:membrane protease subunit HflC